MDKLQYRIKNVYGVERKYPANHIAEIVARMEGSKTLSEAAIADAKLLGFKVEEII